MASAKVHFDATGPLVELLGFGPDPHSPIEVDVNDVLGLGGKLGALEFESDVEIANLDESSVRISLKTERMPAASLLSGGRMRYDLDSFRAVRGEHEIEIDDWDAGFFASGSLDGGVSFRVVTGTKITCEWELIFAEVPLWPEWTGD